MSGISSGIGLVSGIDRTAIIDQLLAIEARPVRALEQRVGDIDVQRTALLELSAKLLAIQSAATRFTRSSLFRQYLARSSHESVLRASAGETSAAGTHRLRVRSLVTQHSIVSRGFQDADRTAVGAGTITIESARARVNPTTDLASLNGGEGVRLGVIRITDRSSATVDIDLSSALTVEDVLDAINSDPRIQVHAKVTGAASNGATGDRIVIEDATGRAEGRLVVADRSGGFTAKDLGILGFVDGARLEGKDLVRLSNSTSLELLNDGNGVGRSQGAGGDLLFHTSYGDFGVTLSDVLAPSTDLRLLNNGQGVRLGVIRITDRSGKSADIDLNGAVTVNDIRGAIDAADIAVDVTVVNAGLQIKDSSGVSGAAAKNLKVEDVSGSAAADLGIAANVASDTISGRSIYRINTLGDVIRSINFAAGNNGFVQASLGEDGKRIAVRALGFDNSVTIRGVAGSTAASDLGIADATFDGNQPFATRRLIGGLGTVLLGGLRGGGGVHLGTVRFTDRANATSVIDFSSAETLQDVIDSVESDPATSFTASINRAGNGIVVQDESGGNLSQFVIEDVTGGLAADLGIEVRSQLGSVFEGNSIDGGNLQRHYISRQTKLSELSVGNEVRLGEIRIIDSAGTIHDVALASNFRTLGEVIDAINLRTPDTLEARINDDGDGIVIRDLTNGSQQLTISDLNGGQAAALLNLDGTAKTGQREIDGSFEVRVDIDAEDTLQEVASKLGQSGAPVTATVVNDGGTSTPFGLVLTSTLAGRRGELLVDSSGVNAHFETLVRAQDAVVTVGPRGAGSSLVVSSSTNTVTGVVPGVTFDLLAASDDEVTVSVEQDLNATVESLRAFVDTYNEAISTINEQTRFDQDSLEKGPLLGDRTVEVIRTRLQRAVTRSFGVDDATFSRLSSVGIRFGNGNRLEFDEEKFQDAYTSAPGSVENLFTTPTNGAGTVLQDALGDLTNDLDGVISRRNNVLTDQQELLNNRIASLNDVLAIKRLRLENQFIGLETALAALQGQQTAVTNLARVLATAPR